MLITIHCYRPCLCLPLILLIIGTPAFCSSDCISLKNDGCSPSQSISPLDDIKFSPTGSTSTCDKIIQCCCVNMGRKRKSTTPTRKSKYFPPGNTESTSTAESPSKKRKSGKSAQEENLFLNSQDIEETLPYSIEASCHEYGEKDFISDDGSDDSTEEGANNHVNSKSSTIEISDNSLDSPNKGKFTMRQSTLNFASKNVGKVSAKIETSKVTRSTFKYSDLDTAEYRMGYPRKKDDLSLKDNLLFYKGSIKSQPNGDKIFHIHDKWFGDYKRLEQHHGYIQWLFPIRENGMNWQAQALQLHEAKAIKSDKEMRLRVLSSYRLMLDFYGMKLVDPDTGKIERSAKWKERFDNLKWSSHNYLRITRILKSLGELGYEHLKKPFLEFVLHEALVERTLERLLRSCQDYWIGTIKDDADRESLHKFIEGRKNW